MTFSFLLQFLDPVVFPQGFFWTYAKNLEDLQCLGPGDDEEMPALVSEQDSDDEDMPSL